MRAQRLKDADQFAELLKFVEQVTQLVHNIMTYSLG